jgi:dTDP-4-dehydrorhamnose reductase
MGLSKKVLITGANGLVGQSLISLMTKDAAFKVYGLSKGKKRISYYTENFTYYDADITEKTILEEIILKINPDIIVHTAALTQIDECEQNKELCYKINVEGTQNLLDIAEKTQAHFIFLSTDFVFDGLNGPYQEKDTPNPVSYYGNSKLTGEQLVQSCSVPWTIVRTVLVYGYHKGMRRNNIVSWVVNALKNEESIKVVNDQFRTPTFVDDLARALMVLAHQQKTGIYHISGAEMCSVLEFAHTVAEVWGFPKTFIEPVSSEKLNQPAKRPLKTGFVILKAQIDIEYTPHTLKQGLNILKQQTKGIW